jgi:hypothetical protein
MTLDRFVVSIRQRVRFDDRERLPKQDQDAGLATGNQVHGFQELGGGFRSIAEASVFGRGDDVATHDGSISKHHYGPSRSDFSILVVSLRGDVFI